MDDMQVQRGDTMDDTPLVSAIIIFLNGEKYIAEAIESILAQTMADWELILVDDGTTDGATEIAQRYARMHPGKIIYTEHPGHENRGMSASRNAGLRLARGKYVAFLDADDIWLPEHLRVYCRILEDDPRLGLVFGRTRLWWSWEDPVRPDGIMDSEVPVWCVLEPPVVMQRILETLGRTVPGICSLVARRDAVLATGGFDESFRTLYEDQVFFARMFLTYPSMATDCVLDCYRQHSDSSTAVARSAGDLLARPRYLAWLDEYMRTHGVDDPALRVLLTQNVQHSEQPPKVRINIKRRLWRGIRRRILKLVKYFSPALARRITNALFQPPRLEPPDAAARAFRDRILEGIEMDRAHSNLMVSWAARYLNAAS